MLTRDTPWSAVAMIARRELRLRWRSLVVLGLLAGLVGAVTAGAAAVAQRSATAYDRLVEATHLDDARVLIFSDSVSPADIEALPGVAKVWRSSQVIGQVIGAPSVFYVSVSSGPPRSDDLFTPVVVRGHAPRDDAPYQVMIPEQQAEEVGLDVGDRLPLKLLTPLEVTQFDTGFGEPDGPAVPLRVVGVYRAARAWIGGGVGPVIGSAGLTEVVPDSFVGQNVLARLSDGPAGAPAVAREVDALAERANTGDAGQEFGVLQASYPTSNGDTDEQAARHTLVAGLVVLLVVALLGGLLALGQALARHHAVGAADQELEAALGLTWGERVVARLLATAPGALLAGVLAGAGAVAAGALEPLGPLRKFEPSPGYLADPWLVAGAVVAATLAFLTVSAVTAARVARQPGRRAAAATLRPLPRVGRHPASLVGLAFALRRASGRSGVPVRATTVVAVLGVAGVLAVGAFATSLDRLVRTPERYGWAADFATVDAKPEDTALLAADPRVRSIAVVDASPVRLDGVRVFGATVRTAHGPVPITLLSGRLPQRPGEVALGSLELARLDVQLGERVTLRTYDEQESRSLSVVGVVLLPDLNGERLGTGAVLAVSDLRAGTRQASFSDALVDVRRDRDVDPLFGSLAQRLEMSRAAMPPQVKNLDALGRLPAVLAAFLAVLAVTVLAHSLVLTARRRRADLAVLRVVGMTPRQVAATMAVMAGTITVIGLVVGPVLGLALGRVVWAEVAANIGVAGDLAIPWWLLAGVVPAALLATTLVVLVPARQAARLSPAEVLRAE